MECPRCKKEVLKLTIPLEGKLGCVECNSGQGRKRPYNVNLNQTFIRDDKTRLTTGKAWEIAHRGKTPEGEVINLKTGRPAQY